MLESLDHSSRQRRCADVLPTGVKFHRWRLGFKQSSLSLITQMLQVCASHVFGRLPLYQHAVFPSSFRIQVGWFISEYQP